MKVDNFVLLLTACISPNGMSFTAVTDPSIREKAYIDALNYYLHNTAYKIVFCNNSGEDLSKKIDDKKNRIEFLSFCGNDYDRNLGKGYGEYQLMKYAFENSSFIMQAHYIVKVTGKLKVKNLKENLNVLPKLFGQREDFLMVKTFPPPVCGTDSRCFMANKGFYERFLSGGEKLINDSHGFYFEHLLYQSVEANKDEFFWVDFPLPPLVDGYSWTDGEKYELLEYTKVAELKMLMDFCDDTNKRITDRFLKFRIVLMKNVFNVKRQWFRIVSKIKLIL